MRSFDFLYPLVGLVIVIVISVLKTGRGDDLCNTISFWFDREWQKLYQPLKLRVQCLWYRRKAGRCLKCGYDLLRNTSGICPECGTPIDQDRCTGV